MVPALIGLYVLLIGLAALGSLWSFRLKRAYGRPFFRAYHFFVLAGFAYALVNFIGEVFAPAILGRDPSMILIYRIVDMVTIPLLGGIFYLLFSWIVGLLGMRARPGLRAAFWGIETLFGTAFVVSSVSHVFGGVSPLTSGAIFALNVIIGTMLIAAVGLLLFAAPAGDDAVRRRLARGLGTAYLIAEAALFAAVLAPLEAIFARHWITHSVAAGVVFLFNFPALLYLQRALGTARLAPGAAPPEAGLTRIARDAGISDREREIVGLVALGLGNKEIGRRLFISPKTVKNHITNIYAKTGARNRVQLANLLRRPENGSGN